MSPFFVFFTVVYFFLGLNFNEVIIIADAIVYFVFGALFSVPLFIFTFLLIMCLVFLAMAVTIF